MKLVLFLSFGFLSFASTAQSQAGYFRLYADNGSFLQCYYIDAGAGLVDVAVIHKRCPGALASQWKVVTGNGFNCIHIEDTVHMPVSVGSTQTGISVGYGSCLSSDILIVTMSYFCMGLSPTCAYLEVAPDPAAASGKIEIVDCASIRMTGGSIRIYFNPTYNCDCPCDPTKSTTWGRVKSLYL